MTPHQHVEAWDKVQARKRAKEAKAVHAILEEGKTYRIRADIGRGKRWYTAIRRTMDDGKPSLYYVEDDFEDYYYETDKLDSSDVREIE